MGVRVIEVRSPLSTDARAASKTPEGKATDWKTAPDAPFTTNAVVAGIAPMAPRISGAGTEIALDPAENDAFKAINRALAGGMTVKFESGDARGARYLVSGTSAAKVEDLATELALRAERRGPSTAAPSVRQRIAVFKPWTASMDE